MKSPTFKLLLIVLWTCTVNTNHVNGQCPILSDPANGRVIQQRDLATYICNIGFTPDGDVERRCEGTRWSGTAPECNSVILNQCESLDPPTNGRLSFIPDTFPTYNAGTVVTYMCNEGWYVSGPRTRECQSNGLWDGSPTNCLPLQCSGLSVPANGLITYTTETIAPFSYGTSASYSCDPGFALVGNMVRTCEGDDSLSAGIWSGIAVTCVAITCSALSLIADGRISYNQRGAPFPFGTSATYFCNVGFTLKGDSNRECGRSGVWSGSDPMCIASTCSSLASLLNGDIAYAPDTTAPFDPETTATYRCNNGFGLSGGDRVRTCSSAPLGVGVWSGIALTCDALTCSRLSTLENGRILFTPDIFPYTNYNTVATYTCNPGFGLTGGDPTRTCGGDDSSISGMWSGIAPVCNSITCIALNSIDNGMISYSPDITAPFDLGTAAVYTCNTRFFLEGNMMRSCGGSEASIVGAWDGTDPRCSAITCSRLTDPSNGVITYTTDTTAPFNYQTTATYSCDNGFRLSAVGNTIRNCVGSTAGPGEWSGAAPFCEAVICDPLSNPTNGLITYSPDTTPPYEFETMASYRCNEGFGLTVGDTTRICVNSATVSEQWSGIEPECSAITCSTLNFIANGVISYNQRGIPHPFGTSAVYSCNEGFYLQGHSSRECGGSSVSGIWSGSAPVCIASTCSSLTAPPNSEIAYAPDTTAPFDFETAATYRCSNGFGLSGGDRVRTCLSGTLEGGVWSGVSATCDMIICPALADVSNSELSYAIPDSSGEVVYSTVASFVCLDGYYLVGSQTRTCTGNGLTITGTWTGSNPTCEAIKCSSLTAPTNGVITYSTDTTAPFDFGTTATYVCDLEFGLSSENRERNCGGSNRLGEWSGTSPTCETIQCTDLPLVPNGIIDYGPDNTVAQYSCDTGYYLQGNDARSCGGNGLSTVGVWSGRDPSCLAVTCPTLPIPINGLISFSLDTSPPYDFQTDANYHCRTGYALSGGDRVRSCVGSSTGPGEWSGVASICGALTCSGLSVPQNGRIFFTPDTTSPYDYNSVATYACNPGFGLTGGDPTRTCGGDDSSTSGVWSGTAPVCNPITCIPLNSIDNGMISYSGPDITAPFDLGTAAVYTCNTGFFLEGNMMRSCGGSEASIVGAWDGTNPRCSAITCSILTDPSNGVITYTTDTTAPFDYQTTATYSCDAGFRLSIGYTARSCVGSTNGPGIWSGTAPTCEVLMCSPLPEPTNGAIRYVTSESDSPPYELGTIAEYTCDIGYGFPVSGVVPVSAICQSDAQSLNGEWIGAQLTCSPIQCNETDLLISNATTTISPDSTPPYGYNSVAMFTCNEGYFLFGDMSRTCLGDGVTDGGLWSGRMPLCELVTCQSLSSPSNGQIDYQGDTAVPFDYQTTVTYSCNNGYGLFGGDRVRTCVSSSAGPGEWNGIAPTCEGVVCTALTAPDNFGRVSYSPDTSEPYNVRTVATYSCNTNFGYGLTGSSTRTCVDGDRLTIAGVWNGVSPSCDYIVCPDLPELTNGVITFQYPALATSLVFETQAFHSCNNGYYLQGSAIRNCTSDGATSVGVWDRNEPSCLDITCTSLTVPTNGFITYVSDTTSPFDYQTTATYGCDAGFELSGGDRVRNCIGSSLGPGEWRGIASICEGVMCTSLPDPDNGEIQYSPDTTAPFDYETIATYSCNDGFGSVGVTERLCGGDDPNAGEWSGNGATCDDVTCSSLSAINNGLIVYSSAGSPYAYGTTATYLCNEGLFLEGNAMRTCGGDVTIGSWDGTNPVCSGILCPTLPPLANGTIEYSESATSLGFMATATYNCNTGYALSGGDSVSTCGASSSGAGEWTGIPPTCELIMCSALPSVTNGEIFYSTDVIAPHDYGTDATTVCNPGYGLRVGGTRSCFGDGSSTTGYWLGTPSLCDPIKCSQLDPISNGMISYNPDSVVGSYDLATIATHSCNEGFYLSGAITRECTGDISSSFGSWNGRSAPTCVAIECPRLTAPTNGFVDYTPTSDTFPFDYLATGTFQCRFGYRLAGGDTVRTCVGSSFGPGEWTGTDPICEALMCPQLSNLTNGLVSFSTLEMDFPPFELGTTATYMCNSGYGLTPSGVDPIRLCESDDDSLNGVWTGQELFCSAVLCDALSPPGNAILIYGPDTAEPYDFGTVATHQCIDGFDLVGDGMRTCVSDRSGTITGIWNNSAPVCSPIVCTALSVPDNGLISYSPDTTPPFDYLTTATYDCNTGFALSGSIPRTLAVCEDLNGGEWVGGRNTCEPIMCSGLPTPINGVLIYNTDTTLPYDFGTVATYQCNLGYGLIVATNTRACNGDSSSTVGVWDGVDPGCDRITCSVLPLISNGGISYSTETTAPYDFTTTATYSCNDGFFLQGSDRRECTGDSADTVGEWSGSAPVCSAITCSSLTPPINGMITYASDTTAPFDYQTTATYSCDSGLGLTSGDVVRSCVFSRTSSIGGDWSGTAPTCEAITCSPLTSIVNGRINYFTDTTPPLDFNTVASHLCDTGYGIEGDVDRICSGDGSSPVGVWSSTATTCGVVMCPTLDTLDNGVITIIPPPGTTTSDYGSLANHACITGYYLSGNQQRNCIGGGSNGVVGIWDGAPPSCELIECSQLNAPDNGFTTFSLGTAAPYSFTTTVTYGCVSGFGLSGGNRMRTCVSSNAGPGEWSGTAPTCEVLICTSLPTPDNGRIIYSIDSTSLYEFGTVATYVCDSGFGLSGGVISSTCGGDDSDPVGTWSGTAPSCLSITCTSLSSISNGVLVYGPDSTNPFNFGTIASYTCDDGFYLTSGSDVRTCGGDGLNTIGSWNGAAPVCLAITCTSLSAPSNGDIVFATDTTEPFNYQTTAAYSCNTGYKLLLTVGDRVRICVGSNAGPGEWIGAAPTCEVITCSGLAPPTNGVISFTNPIAPHVFGTVANYTCNVGYGLVGNVERSCGGLIGEWDGSNPTCVAITCTSLSPISNGMISYSRGITNPFDFGTIATFVCDDGFFLDGSMTSTCGGTASVGLWDESSPICSAILCPSLLNLINGFIEFSESTADLFNYQTAATYVCDTGFGLSGGDRVRTCIGSLGGPGEWSGTAPICEGVVCTALSVPDNFGRVSYSPDTSKPYDVGTVATYSCNTNFGYGLTGSSTRTCVDGDGLTNVGMWNEDAPTCDYILCPNLLGLANGAITFQYPALATTPIFGTQIFHSCNDGYYLQGSAIRNCIGDGATSVGVWDRNEPSCIEVICPSLAIPTDGFITYTPDTTSPFSSQTAATYGCDTGYGLSGGDRMRTCFGSSSGPGEWNGTAPICEATTCADLVDIDNGYVAYASGAATSRPFGDVASYICDTGYSPSHTISRVCGGDGLSPAGVWSGTVATCTIIQCPVLDSISNGDVTITPAAGSSSSLDYGAVARHSCMNGYYLDGNVIRTCTGDGTTMLGLWDGSEPRCRAIECPVLASPANGFISFDLDITAPYSFLTTVTYGCNTGFGLTGGDRTRQCSSSSAGPGVWIGTAPICQAINCVSLPSLRNGMIVYSPDLSEPFSYGTLATFSCNDGFQLDGSNLRTCAGDDSVTIGSWGDPSPACVPVFCSLLPDLANGAITYGSDTTAPFDYLTTATYSCDSGYGLGVAPMGFMRTCGTIGEWTGSDVTCDFVMCSDLPALDNGRIVYSTGVTSPYDFSTVATYVCDTGFGLTGASTRTCEDGNGLTNAGVWNGVAPFCEYITCSALALVNNGVITYDQAGSVAFSFGTSATHTCSEGVFLEGNAVRICSGDGLSVTGLWDGIAPICLDHRCFAVLPNPMNGFITFTEDTTSLGFMATATYGCDMGFGLLGGDRVRTCGSSSSSPGEWSGTSPVCEAVVCSDIPAPDNGRITYSTDTTSPYDFGTVATYVCNTRFGLVGVGSRSCGGDDTSLVGSWSETGSTCEAITCPSLSPPGSAQMIRYSPDTTAPFSHGTTASFFCADGSYLDGVQTRLCSGDGTSTSGLWSGMMPTCRDITCSSLLVLANGIITYTTDTTAPFDDQTTATYSCNFGFRLSTVGNNVRTCVGTNAGPGEWTGAAPFCEPLTCSSLTTPDNGVIMYSTISATTFELSTTASYSCNTGYGLSGSQVTRTCEADAISLSASWSGEALSCSAITCSTLNSISNGGIVYVSDTTDPFDFNTDAIYSCEIGYYLVGNGVRMCGGDGFGLQGAWSGSAPSCEPITCTSLIAPDNGFITYAPDTSEPFEFRTTARYGCNNGFGLSRGDTVITCGAANQGGEQWSGTTPTCEPVMCCDLPTPDNGRIVYSTDVTSPYDFSTVATYVCDTGFGLRGGDNTRSCGGGGPTTSGSWTGRAPTCEVISCTSLNPISNGMIAYSPDYLDFGTTATYTCLEGYFLEGTSTRTCIGDGSGISGNWNGVAPVCSEIVCTNLPSLTNGVVTFATDITSPFEYQTTATYSCDTGYGLFGGDRMRTCVGSSSGPGEWSGTVPTCEAITCMDLSAPTNGRIDYSPEITSPYGFGTTAMYVCDSGFGVSVLEPKICSGDDSSAIGVWSGTTPTCTVIICEFLRPINNGSLSYSTPAPYEFNTMVIYSCDEGFFLEGDMTRMCMGDGRSVTGSWSEGTPVCSGDSCPMLQSPTNGFITFTESSASASTQFKTTATYGCEPGFGVASGDVSRTCQDRESATPGIREWSGTDVTCEAIVCSDLLAPDNGRVSYSTGTTVPYDFGTAATYTCNSGFGLVGGTARSCNGNSSTVDGAWTGTVPTCEAILCTSLAPDINGVIIFAPDNTEPFDFQTTATYGCNEGFFLLGNANYDTRWCDGDGLSTSGVWNSTAPSCSGVECRSLTVPTNGVITYTADTTSPFDYQTTASYSCDAGFGLSGGDRVRTCVRSSLGPGEWSGIAPTCEALMCSYLPAPDNGGIVYSTGITTLYDFGTTATYMCDTGFGISGDNVLRTCRGSGLSPNGTWTGTAPRCDAVTCPPLNSIRYGSIAYSPDSAQRFTFDTVAAHSCNEGYYLVGRSIRTCVGDGSTILGQWSGVPPMCTEIVCSELPRPSSGIILYATDTTESFDYRTAATYVCNSGYGLSGGDRVRMCVGSSQGPGEWRGTAPSCHAIMCSALTVPSNGAIHFTTDMVAPYEFETEATYSCDLGYDVVQGNETRTCDGDGSTAVGRWSGQTPSCETVMCASLPPPTNGQILYFNDSTAPYDHGTVANYICNTGFGIAGGDVNRVCSDDDKNTIGEWTRTTPTCESITCDDLPAPDNGQISFSIYSTSRHDFGTVATYSCEPGFGLSGGDMSRTCGGVGSVTQGTWNGAAITCEPIICSSLPIINNGVIRYSPDTTGAFNYATVATYICNEGFFLDGVENRTCYGDVSSTAGRWTDTAPVCSGILCPTLQSPDNGFITFTEGSTSLVQLITNATYGCNAGFGLSGGDRVRTCVGSNSGPGLWSGTDLTCEALMCSNLNVPDNEVIIYSTDTTSPYDFGTVATYVCDTGFGLIGEEATQTCDGDDSSPNGVWSGRSPMCDVVTCPILDEMDDGVIVYSSVATSTLMFGTIATHSCNNGFYLYGNDTRMCSENGTSIFGVWDTAAPICIEIVCLDLTVPTNGIITYTTDTMAPFDYQTTATYTCDVGFGLLGGDLLRICVGSSSGPGEWSGTAPTCEALTCRGISTPDNGRIVYSTAVSLFYDYKTSATYFCDVGFGISEGSIIRTCGGDGSTPNGIWTGADAMCGEIFCLMLPPLVSGQIEYSPDMNEPLEFNSRASHVCEEGYFLEGNQVRSCFGDGLSTVGNWDGETPICIAITCPIITALTNGATVYDPNTIEPFAYGTTAIHSCQRGFFLRGNMTRICSDGGSSPAGVWDGTQASCEVIECDEELSAPLDAFITFSSVFTLPPFSYQANATYSCEVGFRLSSGNRVRTCIGSTEGPGEWSGTAPTCEAIQCAALREVTKGDIEYSANTTSSFAYGTVATYSCREGFSREGVRRRVCRESEDSENGQWEGTDPVCSPIYCTSLSRIENVLTLYSPDKTEPYDYGTVATHYCNDGFYLMGEGTQYCSDNSTGVIGDWNGSYPVCAGIICSSLSAPNNGSVTFISNATSSSFSYLTNAIYSCAAGLGLTGGDPVRVCGGNVSTGWAGAAPACEAIMCHNLTAPMFGFVNFSTDQTAPHELGTNATYTCIGGYRLNVPDDFDDSFYIRICEGNYSSSMGRWSGFVPTCINIFPDIVYHARDWLVLVYTVLGLVLLLLICSIIIIASYTVGRKHHQKSVSITQPYAEDILYDNPLYASAPLHHLEPESSIEKPPLDDDENLPYDNPTYMSTHFEPKKPPLDDNENLPYNNPTYMSTPLHHFEPERPPLDYNEDVYSTPKKETIDCSLPDDRDPHYETIQPAAGDDESHYETML
ncbi:uncharacterized protein LOC135336171 isoform X3 [Halichondria panicea]|uniref:uncharacterized protein LOC135336171 isoform X3 n=1 Tax=Halichondria panicea TaxID=6063 RepID=UPI00312BC9C3